MNVLVIQTKIWSREKTAGNPMIRFFFFFFCLMLSQLPAVCPNVPTVHKVFSHCKWTKPWFVWPGQRPPLCCVPNCVLFVWAVVRGPFTYLTMVQTKLNSRQSRPRLKEVLAEYHWQDFRYTSSLRFDLIRGGTTVCFKWFPPFPRMPFDKPPREVA